MQATFQELYTEILTQLEAVESGDNAIDTTHLDSIKLRINQIQDWITFHKNWEWRRRTFYLTTLAPYETGTVTVTKASRTVTGSGTTWDAEMRTGYLVIGSKAYKIKSVESSTSLTLEAAYPNATSSGETYKIVFPDYILNHEIAGIINVRINNVDLDIKQYPALTQDIAGAGEPEECAIGKRSWEDFYNTGTVTTDGTATIEGSGTTFPDEVVGLPFRVNQFSKLYTIKSKTDNDTIVLDEAYEGSDVAGAAYAIGPRGSHLVSFRHSPDDNYFVEIEALVRAPKLVSATQYSIIPDHAPILHGATWLALQDFKDENPVRVQQARADFERSLRQMELQHSTSPNLKWISPAEIAVRKDNLRNFNPLRDDFIL